jgi:Calpain family cysteine protease
VNDYVPVDQKGKFVFAHSKADEMGVRLIEKAFAKLHSRYDAIHIGKMAAGFRDLTGAPNIEYTHKIDPRLVLKSYLSS